MRYFIILFFSVCYSAIAQNNFETARQLFKEQKYSAAKALFEKHLRNNPNHYHTIEYLGDVAAAENDWAKAIDYYKILKEKFTTTANYHYKYGGAMGMLAKNSNKFKALNMLPDIKSSFEKAIVLDKYHIDSRMALVMLYLELPGIIGGSERKANNYADEILAISYSNGCLAKAYIEEYFGRHNTAEKYYLKALETDKSDTTIKMIARFYEDKKKQPNKAKEILDLY